MRIDYATQVAQALGVHVSSSAGQVGACAQRQIVEAENRLLEPLVAVVRPRGQEQRLVITLTALQHVSRLAKLAKPVQCPSEPVVRVRRQIGEVLAQRPLQSRTAQQLDPVSVTLERDFRHTLQIRRHGVRAGIAVGEVGERRPQPLRVLRHRPVIAHVECQLHPVDLCGDVCREQLNQLIDPLQGDLRTAVAPCQVGTQAQHVGVISAARDNFPGCLGRGGGLRQVAGSIECVGSEIGRFGTTRGRGVPGPEVVVQIGGFHETLLLQRYSAEDHQRCR